MKQSHRVLLIFPPHTRATEPPLGVGLIAAYLRSCGVHSQVADLNVLAGPYFAATAEPGGRRRWQRAVRHVEEAIRRLREPSGYESRARYRSWVEFFAAALAAWSHDTPWSMTPGDYLDARIPDFGPEAVTKALSVHHEMPFGRLYDDTLTPSLRRFDPTMIGVSITYRSQFLPTLSLIAWLGTHAPGLPVTLGGAFLDSLPEPTVDALSRVVASVALGPGEETMARLLGLPRPDSLFREPRFDDLDLSLYFGPRPVIPLTSTRGCYWHRCAFCAESTMAYHSDNGDAVIARLKALAGRYRRCMIHFTDNAIPPTVLSSLATRGCPAPWWGFVRPTHHLADPGFVRELARGGCAMLQLGFETPSPRLLEQMSKGVDPSLFPAILSNLRSAGIRSYVYLLFALPGETEQDRESSLQFCVEYPPDFLNAAVFRLPPSTAIAREPERFAVETSAGGPCDRYVHVSSEQIHLPQIRRWLSGRFLKHPGIRPIVARTPRYYKSSHAPFL